MDVDFLDVDFLGVDPKGGGSLMDLREAFDLAADERREARRSESPGWAPNSGGSLPGMSVRDEERRLVSSGCDPKVGGSLMDL